MHNGKLNCGKEQADTEKGEILAQTKILFSLSTATKAFFFKSPRQSKTLLQGRDTKKVQITPESFSVSKGLLKQIPPAISALRGSVR